MAANRLFVSQSRLDEWLSEKRVDVDGEVMTTHPEESRFSLKTAVVFTEELTGAGDPHGLIGRVKDLDQIGAIGGEYAAGSVILGDHAYTVVEGFVGEPIRTTAEHAIEATGRPSHGDTLAAAMRTATGDSKRQSGEIDLLARFFLQSRKR